MSRYCSDKCYICGATEDLCQEDIEYDELICNDCYQSQPDKQQEESNPNDSEDS